MATVTTFAHRLLVAGGFAVAVSAAPLVAAIVTSAGPGSPLAQCPATEVLDPASGACKPITDRTEPSFNPVDPGISGLQPGEVTSGQVGEVGRLPEVNGIPCNGDNTGLCIGLEQDNANKALVPPLPAG